MQSAAFQQHIFQAEQGYQEGVKKYQGGRHDHAVKIPLLFNACVMHVKGQVFDCAVTPAILTFLSSLWMPLL